MIYHMTYTSNNCSVVIYICILQDCCTFAGFLAFQVCVSLGPKDKEGLHFNQMIEVRNYFILFLLCFIL